MSLKENIDYVKQEISTEEQFLEGFVKVERFYKKYKFYLFGLITFIIIALIASGISDWMEEQNEATSNKALATLESNPQDSTALKTLKEKNPELYSLYQLKLALAANDPATLNTLASNSDPMVKELASYHAASLDATAPALGQSAGSLQTQLKDMAYLQEAYLLLKENRFEEAKNRLAMIALNSPVKPLANMLEHYTVKGIQ